ncbi:hypothetical protein [Formosa sp. 4Alg 33]|uniref:hypothetical protein n=1 Tax=Formosa sp. 4Alg 33 TaxID=3382189 RepID=UPI003D9C46FF
MKHYYLLFTFLIGFSLSAQVEKATFKPYLFMSYSDDIPETHIYGAMHYTNIHNTVPDEWVGSFYQSGMMHTWYRPAKIYDLPDYHRDAYGYHSIEGGAGYKPANSFHNYKTPQKFTMGGVAGGFGAFSNGPGQGSPGFKNSRKSPTLRWEDNTGRYGAAVISNTLLFPLDGIGFKEGENNKMFGYGYYALPLTEPKSTTAGQNKPTGNRSWTLFFNTANFSGPVAFHTPYHWAKRSLTQESTIGRNLDNSLLKRSPRFQRETNNLPAKKWVNSNGDTYYKISPALMPMDADGIGRIGTMPMNMDNTMWNAVSDWFNGGPVASTNFNAKKGAVHIRTNTNFKASYRLDKTKYIASADFVNRVSDPNDPSAAAFKWKGDLIEKVEGRNLVKLPEYYVLRKGTKSPKAIPESEVPEESGLQALDSRADYENDWEFDNYNREAIYTPMLPEYTYSDKVVDAWKTPGPTAGPFYAKLEDGSTAVYYWYKFNEQPSILNSDMNEAERALIQKRIELIHTNWHSDDQYFPDPKQEKIALDKNLLVTPPKGLEVGYVPICIHQQLSTEKLPDFPVINKL